jgi:hypothetical protein
MDEGGEQAETSGGADSHPPRRSLSWGCQANQGAKVMAISGSPYAAALHLLGKALGNIDQGKDPELWAVANGCLQLARAIQREMEELTARIDAIEGGAKGPP